MLGGIADSFFPPLLCTTAENKFLQSIFLQREFLLEIPGPGLNRSITLERIIYYPKINKSEILPEILYSGLENLQTEMPACIYCNQRMTCSKPNTRPTRLGDSKNQSVLEYYSLGIRQAGRKRG